jgi:hypothetical protein
MTAHTSNNCLYSVFSGVPKLLSFELLKCFGDSTPSTNFFQRTRMGKRDRAQSDTAEASLPKRKFLVFIAVFA